MRHLRKMTWAIIAWSVFVAIWFVGGQVNATHVCSQSADPSACHAGQAIGGALVFFVWFIGFIVLSIIWFMTKKDK